MTRADLPLPQLRALGQTQRRDRWWVQPLLVLLGLSAFIVYSTWAALQGTHYWYEGNGANYLSPFYSPELWGASPHAWVGPKPVWWPSWLLFSPALLILWAPGGFRLTCYYYRGAYYKAFWADPPACAVGEPRFRGTHYRGERWLPLSLQNVHRYFLYLALLFLVILSYDAVVSYIWRSPTGGREFGIGVGTLILTLNPILLGGYTLGCHSLRHIVGGRTDQLSRHPVQKRAWDCVSCFNRRHMIWAWVSLFWVAFADVYIRLCSMGYITDYRLI